jgi:hypothetical protein
VEVRFLLMNRSIYDTNVGCVRLWNTGTGQCHCEQPYTGFDRFDRGQVTALTGICVEVASLSVTVGTGRGTVCLAPMSKKKVRCRYN